MRVKNLAQEHNTMSPARDRTRTRSGVERANHEATVPPLFLKSKDKTPGKRKMCLDLQCAVPENIHTPHKEGIGVSCGVGFL